MTVRTSATERVFTTLREAILTGAMAPGSRHSIYRLAEEHGLSRTPVREAVLRLADAGLVTVERNRGVVVRSVTVADVLEVFELRLLLEVPAVAYAAAHGTPADHDAARDRLDRMRDASRRGDEVAFEEHDRALHAALHAAVPNARLGAEVLALRASIQSRGAVTVHRSRGTAEILAEHEPIVAAVLERDAPAAAAHMRDHLVHTAELLARQVDPEAALEPWRTRVLALVGTGAPTQ